MSVKHMLTLSLVGLFSAASVAKTLTIGLDMSLSNPLVQDPAFAQSAAQFVARDIKAMQDGDNVRIASFGARDHAANMREIAVTIPRKGAGKVARSAEAYLQKIVQDTSNAQSSTNIIAWLEISEFDCSDGGKIIVITDGIESSDQIHPQKLIDGAQALPAPDALASFKGCNVVFYGLGVGWPLAQVKNLRSAWAQYFQAANTPFKAVMK